MRNLDSFYRNHFLLPFALRTYRSRTAKTISLRSPDPASCIYFFDRTEKYRTYSRFPVCFLLNTISFEYARYFLYSFRRQTTLRLIRIPRLHLDPPFRFMLLHFYSVSTPRCSSRIFSPMRIRIIPPASSALALYLAPKI